MTTRERSKFLLIQRTTTIEDLYRALLLADVVQDRADPETTFVFPRDRYKTIRACEAAQRLVHADSSDIETWQSHARGLPPETWREWTLYYAQVIGRRCALLPAEDEDPLEAHEHFTVGRMSRQGPFPPELMPVNALERHDWVPCWDELQKEALDFLHQVTARRDLAVEGAFNAVLYAASKLALDAATSQIESAGSAYSRLGVYSTHQDKIAWIAAIYSRKLYLDTGDPEARSLVVQATLGSPAPPLELSSIPIDRFLGICDEFADAREAFVRQVGKWTERVANQHTTRERHHELRTVVRDEIIPAMHDFNDRSRTAFGRVLGDIEGKLWGKLGLGAVSAVAFKGLGLPLDAAILAGTTVAAAETAGAVGRDLLVHRGERRRTWTAFCAALNDQLARFRGPEPPSV
jgi:hypothetical protein